MADPKGHWATVHGHPVFIADKPGGGKVVAVPTRGEPQGGNRKTFAYRITATDPKGNTYSTSTSDKPETDYRVRELKRKGYTNITVKAL